MKEHLEVKATSAEEKSVALDVAIKDMETLADSTNCWGQDFFREPFEKVMQGVKKIRELDQDVGLVFAKLKAVRLKTVKETTYDSRGIALLIRKILKTNLLAAPGFPMGSPALQYLGPGNVLLASRSVATTSPLVFLMAYLMRRWSSASSILARSRCGVLIPLAVSL